MYPFKPKYVFVLPLQLIWQSEGLFISIIVGEQCESKIESKRKRKQNTALIVGLAVTVLFTIGIVVGLVLYNYDKLRS